MPRTAPPLPEGRPRSFRSTVHGMVFAGRERHLAAVAAGDALTLIPDPPGQESPEVWVHLPSGDPLGHLPPEICSWLAPWLQRGGNAVARAVRVHGEEVPTWKRLLLEVSCE